MTSGSRDPAEGSDLRSGWDSRVGAWNLGPAQVWPGRPGGSGGWPDGLGEPKSGPDPGKRRVSELGQGPWRGSGPAS